jgi:hypothetical protein
MIDEEKIREFVEEHHTTTFDQFVDYPSPSYRVVWKGKEYSSGFCGDMETIVREIILDEFMKLETWFPERPTEAYR